MRIMGEFKYILSNSESLIAEVESGIQIKKGDELNWNGNKLIVESVEDALLTVKKIGSAIIVK